GDIVEKADDVGRAEALAGNHPPAVKLLDETDVAALVAPCLRDLGWVERHARQPGTRFAVYFDLVGPDHAAGRFGLGPLIKELIVRSKFLGKRRRRDFAVIAQVHLGKRIALLVLDVAWHVYAIKKVVDCIGTGEPLAGQNVTHSR